MIKHDFSRPVLLKVLVMLKEYLNLCAIPLCQNLSFFYECMHALYMCGYACACRCKINLECFFFIILYLIEDRSGTPRVKANLNSIATRFMK